MNRSEKLKSREDEIDYIYELLKTTLKKEGYELPKFTHADMGYKSFPIKLKNSIREGDTLDIRIEYDVYD